MRAHVPPVIADVDLHEFVVTGPVETDKGRAGGARDGRGALRIARPAEGAISPDGERGKEDGRGLVEGVGFVPPEMPDEATGVDH